MKINSNEGAEMLIQAIVEHAVVDYQNSLKNIEKYEKELSETHDDNTRMKLVHAKSTKAECERFFHSEYCYGLTGVSGGRLIELINKKVKRAKKRNNGKN